MEPGDFILELKSVLPETCLPWVVTALRQDHCIWDCLQLPELYGKLLAQESSLAETWSPANLALTALQGDALAGNLTATRLRQDLQFPVEAGLRRRAAHTFEAFAARQSSTTAGRAPIEDPLFKITQASLLALALRERRRLLGSWEGLAAELKRSQPGDALGLRISAPDAASEQPADLVAEWGTALACLYGMIPDPVELVRALLPAGASPEQHRLVIHILLSNPLQPDRLEDLLRVILAGLSLEDGLVLLAGFQRQRPEITAGLARDLINLRCGQCQGPEHPQPGVPPEGEPAEYLYHLKRQMLEAAVHRLAKQPIPALAHLNAAWEAAYRLQASLSASQAQILEESGDRELSLPAWKQAVELAPGNSEYLSAQARTLVKAGRMEDANAILAAHTSSDEAINLHPGLKLASAVLRAGGGDGSAARQAAAAALHAYETGGSSEGLVDLLDLSRLLLDLGSPAEAARAARLGLNHYPAEERFLALLGEAQFKLGRLEESAQSTRLAAVIDPGTIALRRQLAVSLEATGEWSQALPERQAVLELAGEDAAQDDLHAFAMCALLSGEAAQAATVCRRAIETDLEDGQAHSMLGRALRLMGDPQGAQEHFFVATQFSPELPEPWLNLAEIQKEAGLTLKGLETLRAGALASPNSPDLFLALGEAYLEDWEGRGHPALTQALAMLQSASSLMDGAPKGLSARIGLRLGETLHKLGHLADARKVLAAAYQDQPGYPNLAQAYVQTLLGSGEHSAAAPVLRRLLETQPEDPANSLELARALIAIQKSPDEAIRCLDYVLTTDYKTSEARGLLAEALHLQGDYASALKAYQAAMETDLVSNPDWCSRLSLGLGKTALAMNQPEIAIAALEEASQADPQNPLIARSLCSAFQATGLDGDALQAARLAVRLAPDDVEILTWFAETIVGLPSSEPAQVRTEATNAFSRAVALQPGAPGLILRQGKVQLLAGDSSAAAATFRRLAAEEKASSEELRQAALYLLDLSDAPGAVACLEKALHMSGSSAYETSGPDGIPLALINAYNRTSNPQAALAVLEQTLDRSPADPALLKLKADLLVELGRPAEALACVQDAIQLDPSSEWVSELHLQAACISRGMGNLAAALEHVEAVLAVEDPAAPGSHYLAARALAASLARSLLMNDRALAFLGAPPEQPEREDASVPLPGWVEYHCLRAELAIDAGDLANAAQALEAAAGYTEISTSQPRLHAIRSRLESASGERDAALFSLNQALTQAGDADSRISSTDLISLSRAALDLCQWDPAVYLARQAVDAAPAEPYLYTCLANAVLLRAESQALLQPAEVIVHAPGASAMSDYARGMFEQALDKTAACLAGSSNIPSLARMKARGMAVFSPGQAAMQALAAVSVYPLTPEDTAAQIAVLRALPALPGGPAAHPLSASPATLALQASRAFPQHPLVLAQLAATLQSTGQHNPEAFSAAQEAVKYLAAEKWVLPALGEQPGAVLDALFAAAALAAGDFDQALTTINRALSVWPDEPRWHALAAQIHDQRRSFDEAVEHLEQACRLEPGNFHHFIHLGRALLSVPIEDQELSERAINAFEKAADLAPDSTDAWMSLAEAYTQAGLLPKAASCSERAITLSPDQPAPLILRAEIALMAGDPQEAYNRIQSAMQMQAETEIIPDLQPILLLSRALDNLDRPAEALAALDKALPRAGEPLPLLLERVHLVRRSQGLPAAIDALQELGEKYPDEPVVLAYLAKAYAETGANEAATASAQRALQSCSHPEVLLILDSSEQARMHLLLGKLLRQAGQLDQSLYHLNEATLKDPRLLEPYLELGRVLQERRQINQALQIYNRATAIAPKDPRPYFQAGLALKESKDYVGAEAMLRRAASLAPNDLGIHRQLGAVVALNLVHNRRRSAMDL